jgi:hypothetical protein
MKFGRALGRAKKCRLRRNVPDARRLPQLIHNEVSRAQFVART